MSNKGLLHEIACDIARVSQELGKIPLRDEYLIHGAFSRKTIDSVGGYTVCMHASGIKYTANQSRPDKQEIRKQVFDKIKEESKVLDTSSKNYSCIQVWGDRHNPYGHKDTNEFLIAIKDKYKPDLVVDIGDGEDYHAMSFHSHDPDLLSAGYELQAAIDINKELYKHFPEVITVDSNHSSMAFRKGLHHGFPRHLLKSYKEVLEAPDGWHWVNELVVTMSNGQKVLLHHGLGANVLAVSKKRGMSVIQGHYHSLHGVQYWANHDQVFFAAQTGCTIDDKMMAFAYNKTTVERPLLGGLVVENGIAKAIPMILDKHGRWIGKVT